MCCLESIICFGAGGAHSLSKECAGVGCALEGICFRRILATSAYA